ncbi:phage tail assembly chaperone [Martelella radicis]|uniref:Uncharacterized protein n=1 Tax=Martelella radicis TaxID=1397476 RepID=A0A7W6PCC2_9HYPH|nr:hypothetical protein [Martelella radicis]MBB4123282.1 hypothetical protein [Martelella radicis]
MTSDACFRRLVISALDQHFASGEVPVLPAGSELLWQWFCELSATRTWNANGPNPISFAEIIAYCRVTGWPISRVHVDILQAMDAAWLKQVAAMQFPEGNSRQNKQSRRTMTPGLFDAIFG